MRLSLVSAAILLLLPLVLGTSDHGRNLLTVDTSCDAFAYLSILVSAGHCDATASANCTILENSRVSKVDTFKEWFEAGACNHTADKIAASALADSVGEVWADAVSEINCTKGNFGCGWSMSDPTGWGSSFAQMLVEAAQEIDIPEDSGLDKFCPQDLSAVGEDLAHDAEKSRSMACGTKHSSSETFHTDFAKSSRNHILHALRRSVSGVCGKMSKKSLCHPGHHEDPIPMCKDHIFAYCCKESAFHHSRCFCPGCHNPIHIVENLKPKVIWEDVTGYKCECPTTTATFPAQ